MQWFQDIAQYVLYHDHYACHCTLYPAAAKDCATHVPKAEGADGGDWIVPPTRLSHRDECKYQITVMGGKVSHEAASVAFVCDAATSLIKVFFIWVTLPPYLYQARIQSGVVLQILHSMLIMPHLASSSSTSSVGASSPFLNSLKPTIVCWVLPPLQSTSEGKHQM